MFNAFSLNIKGKLHTYERPQVMGIINVTPDSFFEGSRVNDKVLLKERAEQMIADGADFIDIGAYSSRPGAKNIDPSVELRRLEMAINAIREVDAEIPVSVDTFRADVAREAISNMGADIINDISGGTLDGKMFETVAELKVPYILMHMRGTPQNMQSFTDYTDVTADIIVDLSHKLRDLRLLGVADIIVDPGFGFSKTTEQNFELMRKLDAFAMLGCPVLVGISRKSMITKTLGIPTADSLAPTVALDAFALTKGSSFLRVHDVREAAQTVKLFELSY